jgi:DNA-binding NtrC family response regulator
VDDGVIIVSANYDVQHFCFAALSRMFSLSLADSWICCDSLLLSYPARLLIIDFDLLQSKEPAFLSCLLTSRQFLRVIILMGPESTFMTARLIKMGVFNVLPFPCSKTHLIQNIQHALRVPRGFTFSENKGTLYSPGGNSTLFEKIAKTDYSVLLLGDSGTGKTYTAQKIVDLSSRKHEKFVRLNCSTIPETLAESELFGTEKGAFTGAENKPGKFEQAHNGTLFLDEVSDLSLSLQAKLLKIIETGSFYKLGSSREMKVNVRLLFATNSDLRKLVEEKKFRFDLYQRISMVQFYLPPLRTQIDKICYFTRAFLAGSGKTIEQEAVDKLKNHSWEGNLRELQNCLIRACVLAESDTISAEHIIFDSILITVP